MAKWDRLLDDTAHRPWPLPGRPWFMTMSWLDLLFAHWPVSVDVLRPHIPAGLEVDSWEGAGWLGVVPFRMSSVGPRGLGWVPGVSRFPELNVRTYVRAGGKPGVWFFILDAASAVAVEVARASFHLPYLRARMRVGHDTDGFVAYESTRTDRRGKSAAFVGRYRPSGDVFRAARGSLEAFLTERYCLYASKRGRLFRGEIHHVPWPLQRAELALEANTMAAAASIALPDEAPLLHFVERLDVLAWTLDPVTIGAELVPRFH
jgi:uncharacterized protein YqjF (DUF2071 family)